MVARPLLHNSYGSFNYISRTIYVQNFLFGLIIQHDPEIAANLRFDIDFNIEGRTHNR